MWPVATLWDRAGKAKASHSQYQRIPNNRGIMCSPLPMTPPQEANTQGRQLLRGNIRSPSPQSALFLLKVASIRGLHKPRNVERKKCLYIYVSSTSRKHGPRAGEAHSAGWQKREPEFYHFPHKSCRVWMLWKG